MTHLFNVSVFLQDLIVDNLQKNDMPRITIISKTFSADFFLQRPLWIEEAALAYSQDTLVSSLSSSTAQKGQLLKLANPLISPPCILPSPEIVALVLNPAA